MSTLIIGGTHGIGLALAKRLGEKGPVLTASRGRAGDPDIVEDAALCGDTIVRLAEELFGCPPSTVIYCPAVYVGREDYAISVNVFGAWRVAHTAAKMMSEGSIVLFSGGGVGGPNPGKDCPALYASTKAAVVQMAECLANEYPNLRINAVAPGPVDTGLTEHGGESPDKTVDFIEWLLEQRHITGRLLSVRWDTKEEWANPSSGKGKLRRIV